MEHAALSSVTFYIYIWSWVFLAIFVLVNTVPMLSVVFIDLMFSSAIHLEVMILTISIAVSVSS
jgi:hypothetical protein